MRGIGDEDILFDRSERHSEGLFGRPEEQVAASWMKMDDWAGGRGVYTHDGRSAEDGGVFS